ncbi:MAG: response regulator transcription factor [Thermoleophilia bacterium]
MSEEARRILLAEDEPALLDAVAYTLGREGFEVTRVTDGAAALDAARADAYDVVILDVMMPRLSGLDVCKRLRDESDVPIILLTAKDAELDRVLGLELGADDYITKPFSMAELVSRTRALLRRRDLDRAGPGTMRVVGDLQLDLARHELTIAGRKVHVTPSEFKLLVLFTAEPGRVFSRRQVMEYLWDSHYVGDERACDVHVSSLRRKIEDDAGDPKRLVTVRGVGYKLETIRPQPVEPAAP